MKKSLLASAVAAATFSGAALAQDTNMPTVYGNIQYALVHDNVDGGDSSIVHRDNGSTLGVTHDHEISPGMTGFFKIELEGINADDKSGSSGINGLDEAYIGIKGDSFGQVWIGSDDSTYESAVDKIAQFYEAADLSLSQSYTTGEGDLIQYKSPSFGGLTLGAAIQVNGDGETTTTVDSPVSVTDGELDTTTVSKDKSYPYQLAATYTMDALEFAVAMDSNDNGDGNNENSYGFAATYNAGDLTLVGEFDTRKDVADKFGVQAIYAMGANQFAVSYEMLSPEADDTDKSTITLQAMHNVSDHMYVYAEGYLGDGDDGVYDVAGESARSVAALGAVYYF